MFVDSHAHISSAPFEEDCNQVIARAREAGVTRILNICTDERSLQLGLSLAAEHAGIYNAAAATPHDVETIGDSFYPQVVKAAAEKKLIAIGETGLDYYYEHSNASVQKEHLLRYFQLAQQQALPLIFHCREAFADLFALADREYRGLPALLHCFTGTLQEAKGVLDRGWYLSLSGIVTFLKSVSLKEIASYVPLDRLLIETDSPYLAPQSKRGKRNEPAFLAETASFLAALKGVGVEEIAAATAKNFDDLFLEKNKTI